MKRRPLLALLVVIVFGGLLLFGLYLSRLPDVRSGETAAQAPGNPTQVASSPSQTAPATPTAGPVVQKWHWPKAGFGGAPVIALTQGIDRYAYYDWSSSCDTPGRHQVPMIWGRTAFYTDHVALADLFDGSCNDGRPLLFLNEPAKAEQADVTPLEAAHMFYTMTRGSDWPYARWQGPIYAGNNLVEDRAWDAEFVRQFADLYNDGSPTIPEIAGWAIHLYANYEYGPEPGDPNVVWTEDIPAEDVPSVVDRSMRLVDEYLAQRKAEGNATSLVVTEFGLLQASTWHDPRAFYYTTTASFMDEYVRRFDLRPEIQAWLWFMSTGPEDSFLDTDLMVDPDGILTPNGVKWRELAGARQQGDAP